ncbi:asparagine synthetase B family protein [Carboxylicivirga marina]|uniref:asparagine synthase (glutamine-hydrolyzing) n=1 Tax=Carboxylicivirga marina TaxID=2800988 RepID=A0ABS1HQH9_9BACT|nr:hypothetical protein [Carboxylicivirga marina]MBK3519936.1 hypothetical protein [Carboxylicivirga marina]
MIVRSERLTEISSFCFEGFIFGLSEGEAKYYVSNEFINKGKAALKELNGSFCGYYVDDETQQLYVFNDRLGMVDLFLMKDGQEWLLCDDYWQAVKANSSISINDMAIEQLLQFGYMHWNNTFLSEIDLCAPATVITIDIKSKSILSTERYWRHIPEPVIYNRSAAKERLYESIKKAVKECFNDQQATYAVANSGGLDSRWNLFCASQQERHFASYTYTGAKKSDAEFVSRKVNALLKQTDSKYIEVCVNDFLPKYANKHLDKTPMLPLYSAWYYGAFRQLEDVSVNVNGFISTFLDAFTYMDKANGYNYYLSQSLTDKYEFCYNLYNITNAKLLSKVYLKSHGNRLKDSFMTHLDELEMNDLGNICDSFDFYCRQRRLNKNESWTNFYGQMQSRSPLVHNDIVDLSLQLPFEMRDNRSLYVETACDVMGDLAGLRLERSPWGLKGEEVGAKGFIKSTLWRADLKLYKKTGHSFWFKGSHKDVAAWMCQYPNMEFIRQLINSNNPLIIERFNQNYLNDNIDALIKKDFVFVSSLLTVFMFLNKLSDIKQI